MLSGCKTYAAISQFGRGKGFALAHVLGFRRGKTPAASTFSILFRKLDIGAFEAVLARWVAARLPAGELHIAIDGKTARGSRDGEAPGQHLVAAYAPSIQAVLAQIRVDAKTNEHKAALELMGILPIRGNIFTGDAMFCQRDLCAAIVAAGGDYVFFAKDNQPSLVSDIKAGLAYEAQARQSAAAFSPLRPSALVDAGACGHQYGQGTWPLGKTHVARDDGADQKLAMGRLASGLRTHS
jgi:hypothetical protein